MTFSLSTNIKSTEFSDINYIVTSNAKKVAGSLVNDYNSGIHCYTLIGTYGTGKSSFLLALENALQSQESELLSNKGQFNCYKKFSCLNIVGDFNTLPVLLCRELNINPESNEEFFDIFDHKLKELKRKKQFLLIAIDEFGKILEHAAKVNPEKEVYFLQQFAEFVNSKSHDNIMVLATLHQDMNSYAKALTKEQKQEWDKVKGRFQEVIFSEPEEQLLLVAAEQLGRNIRHIVDTEGIRELFSLAKKAKIVGNDTLLNVAKKIYPMDIFAGVVVTRAIQKYGQNERSLFNFLTSTDTYSVSSFVPTEHSLYNLANIYDYIAYSFYSYLSEVNSDSANWRASKNAIERVETIFSPAKVEKCTKIVKAISLMNIFCPAIIMDKENLSAYVRLTMDVAKPESLIDELTNQNIIRFAKYKSQYIIFEGSDVNIEDELFKASGQVARPINYIDTLASFVDRKVALSNAAFFKTGTPRFFEFEISDHARDFEISGDVDGYVDLVFSENTNDKKKTQEASLASPKAIVYVFYNKTKEIVDHLYEIEKLSYIKDKVIVNDKVAERELCNLIAFERDAINSIINNSLLTFSKDIQWYFEGKPFKVSNLTDFKKQLSLICDRVYPSTPIIKNELFNRQKVANSAVSLARVTLHNALIDPEKVEQEDLGFEESKYPPEKTIYYTLLKETGIHAERDGVWSLGAPTSDSIKQLWEECERFLQSTTEKQRKIGDLVKVLSTAPFKLKQGFIEMWIPIYLIVKSQSYSLYSDDGIYIPTITREVLDLLQKNPNNFRVKAFAMDGVKLDFFNEYRRFLRKDGRDSITVSSFVETIKPFLAFYRSLNEYARTTQSFDNYNVVKFREVLAKAKDPEKTFFEDMPAAFGFQNESLTSNAEFMAQYQGMIKRATHELSTCYARLIDKIEAHLIEMLGLHSNEFDVYKSEVETRFSLVKEGYLSIKQKNFLKGLLRKENEKIRWYESICYVALEKPLASIKDEELPRLIDNMKSLVSALDKFVDISMATKSDANVDVYNFELVSTKGTIEAQSFVLPDSQKDKSAELEGKLAELLSGDKNLDVCVLLKLLKEKIENN